ncbi:tape measure protein [Mycobacterium phage Squirty]|uniref:Tape measure protein n=1 Tax=Mycobacterium phage Squirty TaxID=1527512 RepID=A0A088F8S6_9CAUD|nr:tail length tape measure protein [Mycobacterium phage Squirty]AIM40962.1 tape measure protein [Mycobacterium phage Squirty]
MTGGECLMPIYVDIISRLDERAAAVAAKNIEREMAAAGARGGSAAGRAIGENVTKEAAAAGRNAGEQLSREVDRATKAAGSRIVDGFAANGVSAGRGFGSSFGSSLASSLPVAGRFSAALSGYEGAASKAGALAGRALGTAFTAAATGIIGVAAVSLFKGFERYKSLDASRVRLENLNRTLEGTGRAGIDVAAVMKTVNDVVDQTAFGLDQAFNVATVALSSNTGDLKRFMTAVADAAGYLNTDLQSVGDAFLQIAATGKVSMDQLSNQLRGIPLSWLAKELNVTGAELASMMEKGEVGLETLIRAVEKNAAGFAKASGDTLEGAINNMNFALSRIGANFLGAVFGKPTEDANELKDAVSQLTARLNDVNAWIVAHGDGIKEAFRDAAETAQDLWNAISKIVGVLSDLGIGVGDVVGAFAAWKAIKGVEWLATALGGINTMLATTLPASAEKGAAGISAALSRIAVPLWLTTLIEDKYPNFPIQDQPDGEDRLFPGWVPLLPFWEDRFRDWFGSDPDTGLPIGPAGPPAPSMSPAVDGILLPGGLGGGPGAQAERRGRSSSAASGSPAGDPILPPPGASGSSSGPKLPDAPVVPYDTTLPPGIPGMPQDAAVFSAESSYLDARHKLAEKRARAAQLEQSTEATEEDRLKARNDVIEAERDLQAAEMRMSDARANQYEKLTKQTDQHAKDLGQIGAQLDQDFGISKGLAGIAENITKFVANLAAAPLLGQLQAISAYNPTQGGHGLMGVLAAQGVFGPQYQNNQYDRGSYPSAGATGVSMTPIGAYPGDAALLANVPAGRYSQTGIADLTKGIGDCSSAVEDLVNILDGRPTGGRSLATGNADQWLTEHGFIKGMGGPGDFRVGFNASHMQATLPGGTPFNWGTDEAAARRGIGGTGADDPAFTSHYYRPIGAAPSALATPTVSTPAATTVAAPALAPSSSGPVPVSVTNWPAQGAGVGVAVPTGGSTATGPAAGSPASGTGAGPLPGPAPISSGAWAPNPAPLPTTGGGGGPMAPGAPQGLFTGGPTNTTTIGANVAPYAGSGSGGIGMDGGGALGMAVQAGGMALDALAPGAGQAAQTGVKLINRAIEYGGQVAAIGAQGLMETFLPTGGSDLANNNWITRIAGGIAGAAPALPNLAGQASQQRKDIDPQATGQGQTQVNQGGDTNITVNNQRATEDGTGRDIAYHLQNQYVMPGG